MNKKFIKGEQTINGKLAEVYANINGEIRQLMEVKNLESKITINQKPVPVLGNLGTSNKYTGWNGSGTMTCYYMTSDFRKAILNYIKTGIMPSISITIINDDPSSGRGIQRTTLGGVTFDSIDLAKVNVEDASLEESLPFKFSEVIDFEGFSDL